MLAHELLEDMVDITLSHARFFAQGCDGGISYALVIGIVRNGKQGDEFTPLVRTMFPDIAHHLNAHVMPFLL
jgi:hypothetical protein